MEEIHQVFVRLLDGKHATLNFTTPSILVASLKNRIHEITAIPVHHQSLLSNNRQLHDEQTLSSSTNTADGTHKFPTVVHLLLRLRGGKGGFGSLLRGAATKAGQKRTNNFDACRDMSGRRLRHVNAEKKLEEWKAEAEERQLEKIAEDFIKKKVKVAKKAGGSGDADKYVEKYRQESAKCMEEVEKSVRESIGSYINSKRKASVAGPNGSAESKRLKIWMGKRKFDESDSDGTDEDEDKSDDDKQEETEKSGVTENENHSDSSKEAEGSLSSITGGKLAGDSSGGCSSESGSEEETVVEGSFESCESPKSVALHGEEDGPSEPASEIPEEKIVQDKDSCLEVAVVSETEAVQSEVQEFSTTDSGNVEEIHGQFLRVSRLGEEGTSDVEVDGNSESKPVVQEETVPASTNVPDLEKPLNFDEVSSAAEMEVLGMERLKYELQTRGLKCGGTLQERAARLFLLKTTPLGMLPKKLLAKK